MRHLALVFAKGKKMGFFSLINKDVVSENETKRGMVTLRILYLILFIAFSVDLVLAGFDTTVHFIARIGIIYAAMILLFIQTYFAGTQTCMMLFVLWMFGWSLSMIPCFGWSAGMQNYFIIILMLSFFATHFRLRFKFILAGLVLSCRILTIFAFAGWEPELSLGGMSVKLIQITNISAVFIGIIVISYIFSKESNEAEGKLMQFNVRLQKQANTDTLTGLANRRKAQSILGKLVHSQEYAAISVAMGDIDFFKKVNDTYGHDAGDEVLKFVARSMKDACKEDSFVARWGGEEFLLVFPGKNGDESRVILEELRSSIGGAAIRVKDQDIRVTMTFGLTEYDYNGDIDSTIKEADEKLYQGKMNGRDQVVY